jgi:hypothetical protein
METYFAKKEGRPLPKLEKPQAPAIAVAAATTVASADARQ